MDNGKTILMVTHDEDLAKRVTRAVTNGDGLIVADEKRTSMPSSELKALLPVNGSGSKIANGNSLAATQGANGNSYLNGNGTATGSGAGQRVQEPVRHA